MVRALYDPQIPPEREVRSRMLATLEAQRGTSAITRGPSEQYIATCRCGAVDVTSDTSLPSRFGREHEGH